MSIESAVVFTILVCVTLGITYWAGKRNKSVESHLVAGGHITGRRNGVAIAGDFISAATFLGTTGAIALGGFNGFYLAVYIPIAYLLCLLLVAEPLRNLGHFTLGDVLATRFRGDGVRGAIATSSVVVSLLYMVAQFVGAALVIKLLFGIPYWWAALAIGILTTVYTLFGGMLATTYIQIIKTALLLTCGALLLVLVLIKFGWNPLSIFQQVSEASDGAALEPARKGAAAQWEQFSLIFGVTLGVLGLPHVMIRFLTVKDGAAARTSAVTAIWIFAIFLITLPFLSYGAVLLVGKDAITKASGGGNLTMPLLSENVGGPLLLAFVSAVAFATILAALSGLVIATTGSISHDLYSKLLKKGQVDHGKQLLVARIATVSSAVVAMLIALAAQQQNVAFLATLAIAVAASANLPALLFTIYWRRATAMGVAWGMVAGLVVAVLIILLSPTFRGGEAILPISSPGLISIPVGFLVMYLVSLATQPRGEALVEADQLFDRIRVQAVTGIDPGDPDDKLYPSKRVADRRTT
ncbi:MAG: cation acetate symporter [Microlunatus sp.]|nr:cation acetate symporter [Microlunatus sp.]MDN5770402.1 cation acetate symporter [Microlunatus sp.]MDN5804086.1 cation acetate symporter [Microlunatus sp.]